MTAIIVVAYIYLSGANLDATVEYGNLFTVSVLILGIIYWIINLEAVVAIFYSIKDSKENIGIKESYSRATSKIFSYYWVALLSGFFIISGLGLFIVPAFIFIVWFSFSTWTLIAENERGINALLKSKEYVEGRWFGVAWRLLFLIFLLGATSIFISFIFSKIKITGLPKIDSDIASQIEKALTSLFITPLSTTYLFVLYSHLKSLKGNFVFEPKNNKWKFIVVAILGILMFLFSFSILYSRRAVLNEYISKFGQEKNLQKQSIIKEINKSDIQDETVGRQTYVNSKDYYEIRYDSPYRVWLDHNLINYDANDPKYEMGNPDGVKIQIQKHNLEKGQTFVDAIIEKNNNIKAAGNDANETQIEKYDLGNIQYANKVLYGPGGKFDAFYSPSNDGKNYFLIIVWNIDNDKKNINLILSTFKSIDIDKVEDWQTYRNEKYGFEIRYPTTWDINGDVDLSGINGYFTIYKKGDRDRYELMQDNSAVIYTPSAALRIFKTDLKTGKEFADKYNNDLGEGLGGEVPITGEYEIDGILGVWRKNCLELASQQGPVVVKNGYAYDFGLPLECIATSGLGKPKNQQLVDFYNNFDQQYKYTHQQILSTFKFINQ